MNVLVSNIDADKKEIDAIKANVNYYLNNNTVNSEILFYLLKIMLNTAAAIYVCLIFMHYADFT